jgi:hypothetical protein
MIEAKLVRNLSGNTTIGELVGTAGLGGYGFNAVLRNVRLAPTAVIRDLISFYTSLISQRTDAILRAPKLATAALSCG